MSDLTHSNDAYNVLNLFYQTDYMVYVEGPDDVCFWEMIFKKVSNLKFEVQDVGGCTELLPYIEKVYNGDIDVIIACDMDLNFFDEAHQEHNKIIRTKKYSIENSMITEEVLVKIIKLLGRYSAKEIQKFDVRQWISEVHERTQALVKLDIGNYIFSKGISVVGDNADRFMESKKSYHLSSNKINSYIESLVINFTEIENNELNNKLLQSDGDISHWLRGHFLFSAALRFISYTLANDNRKISLSNDAFYASLMQAFDSTFNDSNEEYIYYKDKISMIYF